jgi:hypothetical protein
MGAWSIQALEVCLVAAVRCPKCGTANPNGQRRLARCRGCQEPLGKCRYCAHYDSRLLDCISPEKRDGLRIVDADEVLNCAEFASTLPAAGPPRRKARSLARTAAATAALALAAMLGFIYLYRAKSVPVSEMPLRVRATVPQVSFQDDGLDIRVLVVNGAEYAAEGVTVVVRGPSMRYLVWQYTDPSEFHLEGTARAPQALLGDLAPRTVGSVLFHLRADRTGELDLTARATAANMEGAAAARIEGEIVP